MSPALLFAFACGATVANIYYFQPLIGLISQSLSMQPQSNQVMSQRVIYSLSAEMRGRLNAAYMTVMFLMSAVGSALAAGGGRSWFRLGCWWR